MNLGYTILSMATPQLPQIPTGDPDLVNERRVSTFAQRLCRFQIRNVSSQGPSPGEESWHPGWGNTAVKRRVGLDSVA